MTARPSSITTITGAIRTCTVVSLGAIALACGGSGGAANGPGPSTSPSPTLTQLTLFPARLVAVVGETITLRVTARDSAGAEVSNVSPEYSSANPGVVRVEPGGRLVASGAGTATVRATAGGQTAESVIHIGSATYDLASLGPPRVLTASYIDLSAISRISRFRSAIGHSYTDSSGETCRSMKHYFQPKSSVDWTTVAIYAPASGTIWQIAPDGDFGSRIVLRPRDQAALEVTLFHVTLDPGIVANGWVEAGDRIGRHASSGTMSDIAAGIGPRQTGTLVSYFQVMTDAVFAQYQSRGIPSREAAIITRLERDADAVPCSGESPFPVQGTLPNWLVLN
jgi:hypothetical protein